MKKLIIILLAFVLFAGCSPKNQELSPSPEVSPSPSPLTTSPSPKVTTTPEEMTHISLSSIDFLDENNGWIIETIRDSSLNTVETQLMTTHDGGTTWADLKPDIDFSSITRIKFVDTEEGWAIERKAIVDSPNSVDKMYRYTILHTSNGGVNWNVQWEGEKTETYAIDLWFQDSTYGYVQINTTLLMTNDGGEEWEPVSFGNDDFTLRSICFANADTGWALDKSIKNIHMIYVFSTTDGGIRWQQQFSKDYTGYSVSTIDIDFIDADTVWFLTSNIDTKGGDLFFTKNGGADWEIISDVITMRPDALSINFVSKLTGFIPYVGHGGPGGIGFLFTVNGGESWQLAHLPDGIESWIYSDLNTFEVCFASQQRGWVIGSHVSDYFLLRTNDGGITWEQIYP